MAASGTTDETALIAALRRGDEAAFRQLVARQQPSMLAFARSFLRDRAAAEEAVQDTWLALIAGISEFEGRSTLKTWSFSVLANIARSKARREGRTVSFTDMGYNDPGVDADRFSGDGTWLSPPGQWSEIDPERIVGGRQTLEHALAAVDALPDNQRAVVTLRDIEGLSATETCSVLDITDANQRILLHRGRTRVRAALEQVLSPPPA
ncbi:sigma-70 family RNA polymerase sigma factor [Devosia sp. J2-20]|jgi:RNA polymerase sigma-70 factor, ECF subfamily|uniref:RNA polymerase sigma factor n=1 Tax=Devosia TaxID=46913 RepID=UPI0022AF1242|nr:MULTISPECIES: sigma-70 family RNA polymerase sigma factor [Devosia]MCZ4347009.1 sigma-70 family RNA polymerase sigma factor [Devosia neptuniae]WDR00781.1 sigma-70 family RNA polymerase sigma factor [Devosia sp. J2-20]|tara:strand:- start:15475 stop:16098 length:624 start_codon:yes stop_codon:yes gene_type:complete